jgi:hypothetical protein
VRPVRRPKPLDPKSEPTAVAAPSKPVSKGRDPFSGRKHLRDVALTGAELLAQQDEKVEWCWEGVIQRQDQFEVAGATYSGKSTFMALLHVALLAPGPIELLGRKVTPLPPGHVTVLVNVEQQASSLKRQLIACCEALGQDPAKILPRMIIVGRSAFRCDHPAWAELCTLVTTDLAVGLITFDSRARIMQSGDANAEADQARAAEIFGTIAERAKCPVGTVSHVRKSQKDRRTIDLDDVAGHHQRAAGADVVLLVEAERAEDGSVLSSRVRVAKRRDDGGEEHPAAMSFALVRELGKPARLSSGPVASSKPSDLPIQERVYALLKADGEHSAKAMAEKLHASSERVQKGITFLFAERRIELARTERGRNGKPTKIFAARLTQAEVNAELWGDRADG